MTDAERSSGRGERDHRRCPCCDPGLLDDLKCKAKGIAAQAAYNDAHGQELDDARKAFMAARAEYNKARGHAEPLVAKARRHLEELEERIRCQLDREEGECIDRAFGRIVERLVRCGQEHGCCCDGDCDFDDDVRECDPDDVPGLLAKVQRRTEEASECFWDLIGEHTVPSPPPPPSVSASAPASAPAPAPAPTVAATAAAPAAATPAAMARAAAAPTPAAPAAPAASTAPPTSPPPSTPPLAALPARVKALGDEVAAISQAAADGSWKPAKLYAAWLVARRHLKNVWRGFVNVNEYMECLCQALTCMIKGHAAIGELTCQAAVNECHRECWKAGCKYLQENTVAEVLAEYLRVCAEDGDEECEPDRDRDRHRDRDDRDRHGDRDDRDRDDRDRDDRDGDDRDGDDRDGDDRDDDDRGDDDRDDDDRDDDDGDDDDGEEIEVELVELRRRPYRDHRGRYRAP